MTSIAILYNAAYTKSLHKKIDEKLQKRGTHILKSYLLTSGYWSIFSIVSIIIFTVFATKKNAGILYVKITPLTLPFIDTIIDINLLLSSVLFGISALNIFYMLLLMNTIIDGLIEESKKWIKASSIINIKIGAHAQDKTIRNHRQRRKLRGRF